MTSTVIIPSKTRVSVSVPPSFIGKHVEVTFALKEAMDNPRPAKRLSEMFRGTLSKESAESLIKHTQIMREEWDT
jgi:hypothetical protein